MLSPASLDDAGPPAGPVKPNANARLRLETLALKFTQADGRSVTVFDFADTTSIEPGEIVGLKGASGSGKTSLLQVICGIEKPTRGRVWLGATDATGLSAAARDAWRARNFGIVFQDFHLIPELGLEANVVLPQTFRGLRVDAKLRARARELIAGLGLPTDARRAAVLSRGEQQRLAIARALLHSPSIIIADEPTASLDASAAARVAELLVERARTTGATLLLASHDAAVLARLDRILMLEGGRLRDDQARS